MCQKCENPYTFYLIIWILLNVANLFSLLVYVAVIHIHDCNCFFIQKYKIVGLKYEIGDVHPGECVQLVREPMNPKDSNAIRVYNKWNKNLGYIESGAAATLSKVMDQYLSETTSSSLKLSMEGTIALQGAERYSVPLNIVLYIESKVLGSSSDLVQINDALKVLDDWKPHETIIIQLTSTSFPSATNMGMNFNNIEVTNQKVHWEDAQKNLDEMFDQLVNDRLNNLPPISIPTTITSPLLDHQIDGIRWLYNNEKNIDDYLQEQHDKIPKTKSWSVPFYQQIQQGETTVWKSEITGATQTDPPKPNGGSIL